MSKVFGGGGTVNTVQQADPWSGVQPYLTDMFGRGNTLSYGSPYSYAASPFTLQAQQLAAQKAQDPNSLVGQSQSMLGNTISGQYLSPDSNPYLKASVQDALGLAGSAFAKQFGGAAGQNLGNSGYQEALARGLGAAATNAYSNAYGQERQNQLNATQLAPSLDYANIAQLGNVGAQQEARSQAQYNAPWENLYNLQRLISGQPGGTTQGQSPYFTNPAANALGLGLGGMAFYNGMGSLFGGATAATPALATAGAGDVLGTFGPMALA